ncbi:MAG TPA: sigma-70 family RNA polymerase sigma factor [Patescibacteria group bacterium]|nr:sigma-70 family RNA polymerase sigma factor [Patescibacteria group bacterium]
MGKLLKAFLADSKEEAEELYNEYKPLLCSIVNSYVKSTGLDSNDLFSEALLGLAIAKKDFDPTRNDNFKQFALRKIKDSLHEYIRKFSSIVVIPSYIKKTSSLLNRLNVCLLSNGIAEDKVTNLLFYGKESVFYTENMPCSDLFLKLSNAAERATIPYSELVQRAYTLPTDITVNEYCSVHEVEDPMDLMDIQQLLTEEEAIVVEGLNNGKSFKEISIENGYSSASWAHNIIKKVRIKLQAWR